MTHRLVLATANPGKVAEFRAILSPLLASSDSPRIGGGGAISLVTPSEIGFQLPPIDETGKTFAENARLKARAVADLTGEVALADDSGLCVDALDGAPGLHSARWLGTSATDAARMNALLAKLADVPEDQRTARFVCAVCAAAPGGALVEAEGICEGVISKSPRGANGFGYDPIFWLPAQKQTIAEIPAALKNQISHRALALAQLLPLLPPLFPAR